LSDPRYIHEFDPNCGGKCKKIISDRHCHEREDFLPHVRFREMQEECERRIPFVTFTVHNVGIDEMVIRFPDNAESTEEMRQFVEDAIQEKLDRL
jgi:hypothetical protein